MSFLSICLDIQYSVVIERAERMEESVFSSKTNSVLNVLVPMTMEFVNLLCSKFTP